MLGFAENPNNSSTQKRDAGLDDGQLVGILLDFW
jgi:hypothetical protein